MVIPTAAVTITAMAAADAQAGAMLIQKVEQLIARLWIF